MGLIFLRNYLHTHNYLDEGDCNHLKAGSQYTPEGKESALSHSRQKAEGRSFINRNLKLALSWRCRQLGKQRNISA